MQRSNASPSAVYLFAFLFLLSAGVMSACQTETNPEENATTTVEEVEEGTEPAGALGARALYEGYDSYAGQTVTVTAEVRDLHGANAFTIGESEWEEELLVVAPSAVTFSGVGPDSTALTSISQIQPGDFVSVTGTVRQFVLVEVESEYGLDLDPGVETEVEEREPMLVANSISVIPD